VLLHSLSQLNFRNLDLADIAFPSGVSVITGANGAGKSNLLLACYLGLTGLMPFGRITDAVRLGETEAFVGARITHADGDSLIEVGLAPGRKNIRLDGQPVRVEELAARSAAVLITPQDADMVHGPPALRRAYLDSLLSRVSPRYARLAREYSKVLEQRNAMLRAGWFDSSLDVWTDRLIELGSVIEEMRERALDRLRELAQAAYLEIAGTAVAARQLDLSLRSADRGPLAAALLASMAEERARGTTTVGPHREDLILELGRTSVQAFGSRGEARTVALALKVAEFQLLAAKHGEDPVLLLDDFTAELDPDRRRYLLRLLTDASQAIISGAEAPEAAGPVSTQVVTIAAGRLGAA
jgi:DNA replication and repair protein RecF